MNSDNEKTLMQSLRVEDASSELLSLPLFEGYRSEDEILAAWQEGALSAEQERVLKGALASSNRLRQQWLALSAAVPKAQHGAAWHAMFRWHWATIGMTASVALVGVLLFRQGQLPMAPAEMAMQESAVPSVAASNDQPGLLRAPEKKAPYAPVLKQQLAKEEARQGSDDAFAAGSAADALAEIATEDMASEKRIAPESDLAEVLPSPVLADRAEVMSEPQPVSPVAPVAMAPPHPEDNAPHWQAYLAAYGEPGYQDQGLDSEVNQVMARLGVAARAMDDNGCQPESLVALQAAFAEAMASYPETFSSLTPADNAQWCELGAVLERRAQEAMQIE